MLAMNCVEDASVTETLLCVCVCAGMKKLLRLPHGPTTTPASHTAAEVCATVYSSFLFLLFFPPHILLRPLPPSPTHTHLLSLLLPVTFPSLHLYLFPRPTSILLLHHSFPPLHPPSSLYPSTSSIRLCLLITPTGLFSHESSDQ